MKYPDPLHPVLLASLLAAPAVTAHAQAPAAQPEAPAPAPGTPAPGTPAPGTPAPGTPGTPPATPGETQSVPLLPETTIEGENIEKDPTTGFIIVTGRPRVLRGNDEVRGTRLIIDPDTGQVTAEGDVYIRREGREIYSDRATYNLNQQIGQAENARTQVNNLKLRAEQIFIRDGPHYFARRAAFTTCDKEHPHYEGFAREMTLIPDQRLEARNVGIDLLGVRLVTIPKYTRPLREGEQRNNLYPSLGYDRRNGFYAYKEFSLRRSAPVWLDADFQINSNREPSAGILASTVGRLQAVGTAYFRDVAENQRSRFLQVSRLPEVGLVWANRQQPRPGEFLSHQVYGLGVSRAQRESQRVRFEAELSGGYFMQHRGDSVRLPNSESKDGARGVLQGQAVLPRLKAGFFEMNNLRLLARQSVYMNGDAYTVLGTGIGKRFRISRQLEIGIDRFDHWTFGQSPFLFDQVELNQEWRPRLEFRTGGFAFGYVARIRGSDGDLFDQAFSVSKLFHCLQPRLTYRVRTGTVNFELIIPGLSGRNRSNPQSARTRPQDEFSDPAPPIESQPE